MQEHEEKPNQVNFRAVCLITDNGRDRLSFFAEASYRVRGAVSIFRCYADRQAPF